MADPSPIRDVPLERENVLRANVRQARIARVYAEALLALAEKDGQASEVGDELAGFVTGVLDADRVIAAFLTSPAVTRRAREPVLESALKGNASPLVAKFLGVLNQNNRLDLVRSIAAAYQDFLDQKAGRVRIDVRSAVPLTDEQKDELRRTLAGSLHKELVLNLRTDPDLLGGMVVQVGDKVYDTSVRSRLEALRSQLTARATNVIKA
jgi:F-type H+-transporting ATPase subunit delta